MSFTTKPATVVNACSVCLEDYEVGEMITSHEGNGALHPVHRHCLDEWTRQRFTMGLDSNCPTCVINVTSVDGMSIIDYERSLGLDPVHGALMREASRNTLAAIKAGDINEVRRLLDTGLVADPGWMIAIAAEENQLAIVQLLVARTGPMTDERRFHIIANAAKVGAEEIVDFMLQGVQAPIAVVQDQFLDQFHTAIMNASLVGSWPIVRKLLPFGTLSFNTRQNAIHNAMVALRCDRGRDHLEIVKAMTRYPDGTHVWRSAALSFNVENNYFLYNVFIDHAYKLDDEEYMREILITEQVPENERSWSAIKRSLILFKPIVAARLAKAEIYQTALGALSNFVDSLE